MAQVALLEPKELSEVVLSVLSVLSVLPVLAPLLLRSGLSLEDVVEPAGQAQQGALRSLRRLERSHSYPLSMAKLSWRSSLQRFFSPALRSRYRQSALRWDRGRAYDVPQEVQG